jgi:hypothetical protein
MAGISVVVVLNSVVAVVDPASTVRDQRQSEGKHPQLRLGDQETEIETGAMILLMVDSSCIIFRRLYQNVSHQ